MLHVDFQGLTDECRARRIGTISWDGTQVTLDPPDSRVLTELLETSIYDPVSQRRLTFDAEPEKFLKTMPIQYTSPYFLATVRGTVPPITEERKEQIRKALSVPERSEGDRDHHGEPGVVPDRS